MKTKKVAENLFKNCAVSLDGKEDAGIKVIDPKFYKMTIAHGSLGFGESYMEGYWESEKLDETLYRIIKHDIKNALKSISFNELAHAARYKLFNMQTKKRSKKVGAQHYDIGNELYTKMLDPEMNYSCGYWKNADNLTKAQFDKLDLICKKIKLKPGMRIIDIGCGWGSFARHAAKNYGVEVYGISISREQVKKAKELSKGLDIKYELKDYRDVYDKFDAAVSIGMFEHVGQKNYKTYFKKIAGLLKEEGLFLLHTIGDSQKVKAPDPWIEKYIFPNSVLPSSAEIAKAVEKHFVIEDWHNFGSDYDKTLMAWYENFKNGWQELKMSKKYNDTFYRMWEFYLLACAALFRARKAHLYQVVLSKDGVKGGYDSIR